MSNELETLLQQAEAQAETYAFTTFSSEERCMIDDSGRIINLASQARMLGVENDKAVERVFFQAPRYVGDNVGLDLSQCTVYINYMNAAGKKDQYIVEDLNVSEEDSSQVTFSWLLSRKVTQYHGEVNFIVCARKIKTSGEIEQEWNTTLARANVLEGLEPEPYEIPEEDMDIVNQLISVVEEQIEAKAEDVLATIPSDYTELSNKVNSADAELIDIRIGYDGTEYENAGEAVRGQVGSFSEDIKNTSDKYIHVSLGKNRFNKNSKNNIVGMFLDGKGNELSNQSAYITHFIEVTPNEVYSKTDFLNSGGYGCFYDDNFNFISSFLDKSITVPERSKYVRLSGEINKLDLAQFELGSKSTSYEEYTDNKNLDELKKEVDNKITNPVGGYDGYVLAKKDEETEWVELLSENDLNNLKKDFNSVVDVIKSNNIFNIDSEENIANANINSNGEVVIGEEIKSYVSYYMTVDKNKPIKSTQNLNASIYCYDSKYQYLGAIGYLNKQNSPVDLIENTSFIRAVYWPSTTREWMFYQSESDLPYEPYSDNIQYLIKEETLPEEIREIPEKVKEIIYRKKMVIENTGDIFDFYNSMLAAYNQGNTDVYVKGETYTYTNELVDYIRSLGQRGIPIGNNNKYYFETTAKIYCEYTGSVEDVKSMFSPLDSWNVANSFEIYNLTLIAKNTVYALHDEMNSAKEFCRHIYENCRIELDNTALSKESVYLSKAIGGGLGQNEEIIIKNCWFKSINPYYDDGIVRGDVSYHGAQSGNSDVKLVVTGCYFYQTFGFDTTYDREIIPMALFSNNSHRGNVYANPKYWELYQWNNVKRDA